MPKKNNNKSKLLKNFIAFESYGVKLRITATEPGLINEIEARIKLLLPNGFKEIAYGKAVHTFSVRKNKEAHFVLFKGRNKETYGNDKEIFFNFFDSKVRLTIAEFAESRVFIHAGVVEWKGKAIILPAKSFQGKTTLVKELTKLGAKYYSDEYAVLDENGLVHPFPKTLSIRGIAGKYQQVEFPVETFGGVKGVEPLLVGMILLTEFESDAKWQPQILSDGLGVMELLSHTIPIRYNPKFSLKVLNKTVNRAIIVKTKRGEAKDFALNLLSFFESKAF
jgi:hypothetical protein